MRRLIAFLVIVGGLATVRIGGQQQPPPPRFQSSINLVLVDVVVRDRSGAIVKGLTADDFELVEDGARQQILTFAFEDIRTNAQPIENASALAGAGHTPTAVAMAPAIAA